MHQKQNPAGFYTKGEEIFNAVSHGAGSVLAIGGTGALVALAAALANWRTVLICLVYGLSLVVLYTMSTLYHAFPFEGVKRLFRVFDHSSIYLLIAGSYTPFTLILLDGTWKGPVICGVVWAAALLGVTLNAVSVEFVRPWRRGVFPYSVLPRAGRSGALHTRQPCACFQRLSVGYHARMARRASSASSPGFCCCSKRMQKSIISSIVQSAVKPPF